MINLTPKHLRCIAGSCPAVYEITPADLKCAMTASCPGVHVIDGSDDLIIVGKRLSPELEAKLAGKIGPDEVANRIGRAYFANVDPFPSNLTAPGPYEPIDENYRKPDVWDV